jgi:uncharacterized phage protein (TIGR02218 family)
MKVISAELQAHLEQPVTTLATCWRLRRRDGEILGFTDHDKALVIDAVTYQATTGFTPTAIVGSSGLEVDNLDIEGMLESEALRETDIIAGVYDFAEMEVFSVNYRDLTQGKLPLRFGWIGEITWNGTRFVAEIRGLTQKLSQTIGDTYSPTCRASLGDARCGVNLESRTVTGVLSGVASATVLLDAGRTEVAGTYAGGLLTWLSGENAGISIEVKSSQPGQLMLVLPAAYLPQVGDSYRLVEGCNKRFDTCKTRFGNAVNFRGEPHVPGLDKMLETAATRN